MTTPARSSRRRVLAPSIIGLATVLAGCGGQDEPLTVTLMASGSADATEVSYRIDDVETTEQVTLPWKLPIEVSGEFDVELVVRNLTDDGAVACRIEVGPGSPDIAGEMSATCSMKGSASGDTLDLTSEADFADRPESRRGRGETAQTVEVEGLTVTAQIRDADGEPVDELVLDQPFTAVIVVEGIDREVTFRADSVLDDGVMRYSDNKAIRVETDDLRDGILVMPIRQFSVDEPGPHRWTVSGGVYGSDDDFEATFEMSLEVTPATD